MSTIENLEQLTGLPRAEMDKVFQEVKANRARLDGCVKPHDFSICLDRRTKAPIGDPTPQQRFGCYWRCSKCGGVFNSHDKIVYEQGLRDAK